MRFFTFTLIAVLIASASMAQPKTDETVRELREIILTFKTDSNEARTELELKKSDLEKAVADSQNAEAFTLLGRAFFYAEADTDAMNAFRKALDIDPSMGDAHFFMGLIERYVGNLSEAEKAFRKAVETDAKDERYLLELARTLDMKGDSGRAITEYERVIELNQENFDANYALGILYSEAGRTPEAENRFSAAMVSNPTDTDTHFNLGQLYQNTGRNKLALESFKRVVEIDEDDWRAVTKLIQTNEAIEDFEARDSAVSEIYRLWQTRQHQDLTEQGFFIRDQIETEHGRLFALEYFELNGTRPRKYVFNMQDEVTQGIKFSLSLGSYDVTTDFARASGEIGPDERRYHLDGYSENGSHFTYGFFDELPPYDDVKEMVLKVISGEIDAISSTIPY